MFQKNVKNFPEKYRHSKKSWKGRRAWLQTIGQESLVAKLLLKDLFAIIFDNCQDRSEITVWYSYHLTPRLKPSLWTKVPSGCYRLIIVQNCWAKNYVIMSKWSVKEEDKDQDDDLKKNVQLPDCSKTLWRLQKLSICYQK